MTDSINILVIDGYSPEGRKDLVDGGAGEAGILYDKMLRRIIPEIHCDIIHPSDPGAQLQSGVDLEQYDGITWTGCSLTIYDDDPRVHAQIALARAAFEKGIPSFGSCWALQIAVVTAGGTVRAHPEGREMGIARKISLTPVGRGHPLYIGKRDVFDGFISHVDEVTHLPPGAVLLSSNAYTRVQSAAVTFKNGTFWGLQYHPEYDLHELARLTYCRIGKLIQGGFFRDRATAEHYVELLEELHAQPERKDLAWLLGVDADVANETVRTCEVRNWLEQLVLPRCGR